jgi:signal transduction histidine kinase
LTEASTRIAALERALAEARVREQATADVLRVISRTPASLEASLQAVANTAAQLCGADFCRVWLRAGEYLVAGPHVSLGDVEAVLGSGDRLGPLASLTNGPAEAVRSGRTMHLDDPQRSAIERGGSAESLAWLAESLRRTGIRTQLHVPLVRGDGVAGVLSLSRVGEVRPFSVGEIALAESFADQAVIAIENARLVAELHAKSRELEDMNSRLEAATRHKSAFVANMSHELRTPLNAIIGYSEMLAEEAEELGQGHMTADLGKVNAAGKHLLSLINTILDLSKIEAGRMDLYLEDFAVADLVRDVVAVVQPLVEQHGNALVVKAAPALGMMHADLTKVRQALFNLLSNAAKFTAQGTITLTASRSDDLLTFTVTDTGIGMTEEQLSRLFQAFSQAEVDTARRFGGTGLGLALSREFCRLMGGDIGVASTPGQGSCFTVQLPSRVSAPTSTG